MKRGPGKCVHCDLPVPETFLVNGFGETLHKECFQPRREWYDAQEKAKAKARTLLPEADPAPEPEPEPLPDDIEELFI